MGGQGHHTSRSSTQLLLLGYRYVTAIKPNGSFTFFVWKNIQQLMSNFIFIYRKHTLTWKPSKAARLKRKAIIWTTKSKKPEGSLFYIDYLISPNFLEVYTFSSSTEMKCARVPVFKYLNITQIFQCKKL